MNENLAPKAVKAALDGDWKLAIKYNENILKSDKEDIDALNRLARAYSETGKIKRAIRISKKVIKIDPFNKIACKCIERWNNIKDNLEKISSGTYSPTLFIEEPGKTKIAELINLSSQKTILSLNCADRVSMNLQGHRVSVTTNEGKYIGRLPDDLGKRIKTLSSKGNEYEVLIKSLNPKKVSVFIKQVKTATNMDSEISFPSEKVQYISYTSPELIHDKHIVDSDEIEDL